MVVGEFNSGKSAFINALLGFVRSRGYDGVDLDWEIKRIGVAR